MNRRNAIAWVSGLVIVAIATAPLSPLVGRTGLNPQGLTAVESSGSVWRGVLRAASWRGQPLGNVSIRLQALPLLLGERRLQVSSASWHGVLIDGGRHGLVDANGTLDVPALAALAGASLNLSMQDAVLVFEDQRCADAAGGLQATLRMADPAVPELRLSGTLSCAGDQGRAVLTSQADSPVDLEAVLTLAADGGYHLQSSVRAPDPATKLALQLAGFGDTPSGLVRRDSGHLAR